jgi:hypothetical protein
MEKHKHYDLILAWAAGAQIQYLSFITNEWHDCPGNNPPWHEKATYRIKPEPKPDVVVYKHVTRVGMTFHCDREDKNPYPNLMLVIDGETGVLKAAEVI